MYLHFLLYKLCCNISPFGSFSMLKIEKITIFSEIRKFYFILQYKLVSTCYLPFLLDIKPYIYQNKVCCNLMSPFFAQLTLWAMVQGCASLGRNEFIQTLSQQRLRAELCAYMSTCNISLGMPSWVSKLSIDLVEPEVQLRFRPN